MNFFLPIYNFKLDLGKQLKELDLERTSAQVQKPRPRILVYKVATRNYQASL